jgi:magnesium transporter
MITAIGITTENQIKTDLDLNTTDLSAYKWTWIDFENPTTEEVQHLKDTFHFHPLAIEDCLQLLQRPKLDYYEGYTFYVTHHVHTRAERKSSRKNWTFLSRKISS